MEIIINDINQMRELGNKIGSLLKGGETILLYGDLGAGKTHLTKFIGEGMGIDEYITSPTFALLNIYEGRTNLYHFDTYRLEEGADMDLLGFDDYLYSDDGVSIVEWPDRIMEILPQDRLEIHISKVNEDSRLVKLVYTDKYQELVDSI